MEYLNSPTLLGDPKYPKKILLFDIESTPLVTYTWGIWQQDVIEVKEEWYMLSFAYKWLGEKQTQVIGLIDFPDYEKNKKDDSGLVAKLHELFEQADVIVAHNADNFDIKKANARFVALDMEPPSPYKTIDTLKLARRYFKFDSNKLDYLGQHLKLGRKLPHTGKHLWFGCMEGDPKSWKTMKEYNRQDVILLEKVFLKLRGWAKNGPNFNLIMGTYTNCPRCGSDHVQKAGFEATNVCIYQTYRCMNCGARPRGEKIDRAKVELK